jgi:hypothetical protein
VAFPPPPGYDPGNEAQLASSYFAPLSGSSSEGFHSFLSEWIEKASRLSLAEPFGSDSGRHRISSRLLFLSSSASPRRLPIPLSVSKTVTFVTRALYVRPRSEVNFLCVLFFGSDSNQFLIADYPQITQITFVRRLRRLRLRKSKASIFERASSKI